MSFVDAIRAQVARRRMPRPGSPGMAHKQRLMAMLAKQYAGGPMPPQMPPGIGSATANPLMAQVAGRMPGAQGQIDPGFMMQGLQQPQGVQWGGHRFNDISSLIGWEQRHGNRTDDAVFMQQHPALVAAFDKLHAQRAGYGRGIGRARIPRRRPMPPQPLPSPYGMGGGGPVY